MRSRDIAIVAVAIVIFILGWSQEGALNFKHGFTIPIQDTVYAGYVIPKPLVLDVGGTPVLLASTESGYLALYETSYIQGTMENAFIPITPTAVHHVGGFISAIGAGPLTHNSTEMAVFVLNSSGELIRVAVTGSPMTLVQLWRAESIPSMYTQVNAFHGSIVVVPHRVHSGDEGLVTVAMPVTDSTGAEMMMFAAFNGADGTLRWRLFSDMGNAMRQVVEEAADIGVDTGRTDKEMLHLLNGEDVAVSVGLNTHQTHDNGTVFMQPWTNLREAVIGALPHHYNHAWDAHLRAHSLFKAKTKRKHRGKEEATKKRVTVRFGDYIIRTHDEDYGTLGEKLRNVLSLRRSKAKSTRNSPQELLRHRPANHYAQANAFVYHGRYGMELIHMFTGNIIARVTPLRPFEDYYHDVNDDFNIDSVSTRVGTRTRSDGAHLFDQSLACLGTVASGVPEASDSLMSATICDTEGVLSHLNFIHNFLDGDLHEDDVPTAVDKLELLGSRNIVSESTRAVTPIVVQTHVPRGHNAQQVERLAIFMVDSGLVTCLNPSRRRVLWRTNTRSEFSSADDERAAGRSVRSKDTELTQDSRRRPHPHLSSYSLYQLASEDDVTYVGGRHRYDHTDPYVLAVGEDTLSALHTRNGKVAVTVPLPGVPVAPTIVTDFNGDGTNDLIIVTESGVYGFVAGTQASSETLAVLMVLMMALLGLLFLGREVVAKEHDAEDAEATAAGPPQPPTFKRATD